VASVETRVPYQDLTMERYIKHNSEFGLAICIDCQSGVPKNFVQRHFRTWHKETWRAHKKELTEWVSDMTLVETGQLYDPETIREPICGIAIKDGWACEEDDCTVCGVSEKYVENHCRDIHGREAVTAKA
jgi:hypothetical protein